MLPKAPAHLRLAACAAAILALGAGALVLAAGDSIEQPGQPAKKPETRARPQLDEPAMENPGSLERFIQKRKLVRAIEAAPKWEYAILRWQREADGPPEKYAMYWSGGQFKGDTREQFLRALSLDADATDVEMLNYFGAQHWEVCGRDTFDAFNGGTATPGALPGVSIVGLPELTGKRTVAIYMKRQVQ